MSLEYAERRIKEALRQSGGNKTRARQQVIAWTYEDAKLLQALTKHHLSGITAYHIERVSAGRTVVTPVSKPVKGKARTSRTSKKTTSDSQKNFGRELLEAVAGSEAAVFGLEGYMPGGKRRKSSKRHEEAIRRLAAQRSSEGKKSGSGSDSEDE